MSNHEKSLSQNKLNSWIWSILLVSAFTISCAKKSGEIKAIKQAQSKTLNADASRASVQAAQAQNILYQLVSIEYPTAEASKNGVYQVKSEIKTPDNQFIVITTTHENGSESYGIIEDTKNQNKLDVRAKCEGEGCSKYSMLITVVRNSQALHQIGALSFSSDCAFRVENNNVSVSQKLYRTLNDFITAYADQRADGDYNPENIEGCSGAISN